MKKRAHLVVSYSCLLGLSGVCGGLIIAIRMNKEHLNYMRDGRVLVFRPVRD
jgi:hypothetical protein